MSEKKYYVKSLLKQNSPSSLWLDSVGTFDYSSLRKAYTKSELAEIMDGVLYRTFTHQFHPQLAEELYKLGNPNTLPTWIM